MMTFGFQTDSFNSINWSFDKSLEWVQKNRVRFIECGPFDGVSYMLGLGYSPHRTLYEDPLFLQEKMDRHGVRFSQVDVACLVSGEGRSIRGVPYELKALHWPAQVGCPCLDLSTF